eukprot:tig00000157_g9623.t1
MERFALLDQYERTVLRASKFSSFPPKGVKTFATLLFAFPLAALRRCVPRGTPRYALDAFFGLVLLVLLCGRDAAHALALAFIAYLLIALFPRSPFLTFAAAFAYLSAVHAYRIADPSLSYDGVIMILVTSLAFDGADVAARGKAAGPPAPLPYLGYCFFFAGFAVGPWFEFDAYVAATGAGSDPPPSPPLGRAVRCVLASLACLGVTLAAPAAGLKIDRLYDPAFLVDTSFLHRSLYAWAAIICMRFKYHLVWYLSEAACLLAGLGYNGTGPDGKPRWDRCQNADVVGVELAENFKEANSKWNRTVATYLERYVYRRCGRGLPATAATFFVSAFWHGFYPGYYISFVSAAFAVQAARYLRRVLRPRFVRRDAGTGAELPPGPAKRAYDAAGVLLTSLALQYFGAPFVLLHAGPSLALWRSLGYCGHAAVALLLLASALRPAREPRPKAPAKAA